MAITTFQLFLTASASAAAIAFLAFSKRDRRAVGAAALALVASALLREAEAVPSATMAASGGELSAWSCISSQVRPVVVARRTTSAA